MGFEEWGTPWAQEAARIRGAENRRKRRRNWQEKARQNPELARNIKAIRRENPWMRPGAVAALALGGHGPDSPAVRAASQASARKALRTGLWGTPGERQSAAPVRNAFKANWEGPTFRGTRRGGSGLGDVLGQAGDFLGRQVEKIPGFDIFGDPDAPRQQPLRAVVEKAADEVGVLPEVRGLSRASMLALQVGNDYVSSQVRGQVRAAQNLAAGRPGANWSEAQENPLGARDLYQQSQAFRALDALTHGRKVDVGSGWFPDPNTRTGQEAAAYARRAAPTINGHAFTVGRWVANEVADPDTKLYKVLSGGIDGTIAVGLDPTNIAFGAWSTAARGRNLVRAGQSAEEIAAGEKALRAAALTRKARLAEREAAQGLGRLVPEGTDIVWDQLDQLKALAREARGEADAARTAALESAGAYSRWRRMVHPPTVGQFLASERGQNMMRWPLEIAQRTDMDDADKAYTIWVASKRQLPWNTAKDLADARTTEDSLRVWREHLGISTKEAPTFRAPVVKRSGQEQSRLAYLASARFPNNAQIDFSDLDRTVRDVDDWLRNAKVPYERRARIFDGIIRAGPTDRMAVIHQIDDAAAEALVAKGIPESVAREMMRHAQTQRDTMSLFATTDIAEGRTMNPASWIDENGKRHSAPMLESEFFNTTYVLPNAREMRHAVRSGPLPSYAKVHARNDVLTERIADLRGRLAGADDVDEVERISAKIETLEHQRKTNKAWLISARTGRQFSSGVDFAMSYWRTFKLLRIAWGVRVVGEELTRLWGFGFSGPLRHPLEWLGVVASSKPDSRLAKVLAGIGQDAKYGPDVVERVMRDDDTFIEGMNKSRLESFVGHAEGKRGGFGPDSPVVEGGGYRLLGPSEAGYAEAWAEELTRLRRSGVVRGLLEAGSPEESYRWFLHGDGRKWREALAENPAYRGIDVDDTMARRYIDSVWDRIDHATGGKHPDLIEAITTGRIKGNKTRFAEDPDQLRDYLRVGPEEMRARADMLGEGADWWTKAYASRMTRVMDELMYTLMPRPSNYLSRAPMFKQSYWRDNVPALMGFATEKVQKKVLAAAEKAGLSADEMRVLRNTPAYVGPEAINTIDELDFLAKSRALDTTRDALYDLAEKGQVFDLLRNIVPFGEAWREVLTRWARIGIENPRVLHRLDQAIEGGREAGWFTKDPTTNQETFVFPGSEILTEKLVGVPVPLKGALGGLNIVGQVAPGVGPVVALPMSYFWAPNADPTSGMDKVIYDLVFPFGNDETGDVPGDLINEMLPTWGKYGRLALEGALNHGPTNSRAFAANFQQMVSYYASTGRYDLHGDNAATEMERLIADANKATNTFLVVRMLASGTLPTAPIPKWLVKDRENRLVELTVLRDKWSEKAYGKDGHRGVGPDAADKWLIETYGPDVLVATESSSKPVVPGSVFPRTREGWQVVQEHPWMRDAYGEVYGALITEDGKFDLAAYDLSYKRGALEPRTAQERLEMANHRLASWVYDKTLSEHDIRPGSPAATALREELKRDYPGFDAQAYDYRRASRQIDQLRHFVADDRISELPESSRRAAEATRIYLVNRDKAIEAAPYSLKAKGSKAQRDWLLNTVARDLINRYPSFRRVWDTILRSEFDWDSLPRWATGAAAPTFPHRRTEPTSRRFPRLDPLNLERIRPAPPGAAVGGAAALKVVSDFVADVRDEFPELWKKAGNPSIDVADLSKSPVAPRPMAYITRSGKPVVLVDPTTSKFYQDDPQTARDFVIHELGHAWTRDWSDKQYDKYARIRGFPANTSRDTLVEDVAEVFTYAMGTMTDRRIEQVAEAKSRGEVFLSPGQAPYGFQNAPWTNAYGPPDLSQLARLVLTGLFPKHNKRGPLRTLSDARRVLSNPAGAQSWILDRNRRERDAARSYMKAAS